MTKRSLTYRIFNKLSGGSGPRLTAAAKAERKRDRKGLTDSDPGTDAVIEAAVTWLSLAQDQSATRDGGVARHYGLLDGWASSYPETTGYIIPTFLDCAGEREDGQALRDRARRMLDWLVSIQMQSGAFQGGKIDSTPVAPVTFNTGQILLGLAAGHAAFGAYEKPVQRAADWLVETQDEDGCWRKFPTPFAAAGEKSYETHVAWGLLEAARLFPGRGYARSAMANISWALSHQRDNGWLGKCSLDDVSKPLTHTLGYALRGVLEGVRFSNDADLLLAARRTADGMLSALNDDGFLAGRLYDDWSPAATWCCLTGTAQVAHCWLLLHRFTGEHQYRAAGELANKYVRRTVNVVGDVNVRGAVKGSFPIDGGYDRYRFPNWAAKFLIDSLREERELARS